MRGLTPMQFVTGGLVTALGALAYRRYARRRLLERVVSVPPILTRAQIEARYGFPSFTAAPTAAEPGAVTLDPAWVAKNLGTVHIPELKMLAEKKIPGAPASGDVTFVKGKPSEALRDLFAEWNRAGILGDVTSWDGSYNPRFVRGSTTELSRHFGLAFDLNAGDNPQGSRGLDPASPGTLARLEAVAVRSGKWTTGRDFKNPDPHHFEYIGP